MGLVIFRRFFNFGPFFEPFLGAVVENSKHKRVAPVFPKCTISGPQLSWRGLVWYLLNSYFLIRAGFIIIYFVTSGRPVCEFPSSTSRIQSDQ